MKAKKTDKPKKTGGNVTVPVSLPPRLKAEVVDVAKFLDLSEQDTMRQALFQGLPILKKALSVPGAAQDLMLLEGGGA